jgi:hypothetical protein
MVTIACRSGTSRPQELNIAGRLSGWRIVELVISRRRLVLEVVIIGVADFNNLQLGIR